MIAASAALNIMTSAAYVLVFVLAAAPSACGQRQGCLFGGDQRCGSCGPTDISCPDTPAGVCPDSQYALEGFIFYGAPYLGAEDFCEAYMQVAVNQPGDVTEDELDNIETGIPRLAYAISRIVYNVDGKFNVSNGCATDVLKNGITGGDLQNCLNEFIVGQGESVLEQAACEYVSGGVLTPFCTSGLFKGACGVVNAFVNQYIEQPIVNAMDKVEDSLAGIAKTCASWFSGLFSAKRLSHKKTNSSVVV